MPPTIHDPPRAPISNRMMMAPPTPPIFSARAFSKSVHVMTFLSNPILTHTAVATIRDICEAPESVSSPNIETTIEMSATSKTSGTHANISSNCFFNVQKTYAVIFFSLPNKENISRALIRQRPIKIAQLYIRGILFHNIEGNMLA